MMWIKLFLIGTGCLALFGMAILAEMVVWGSIGSVLFR